MIFTVGKTKDLLIIYTVATLLGRPFNCLWAQIVIQSITLHQASGFGDAHVTNQVSESWRG